MDWGVLFLVVATLVTILFSTVMIVVLVPTVIVLFPRIVLLVKKYYPSSENIYLEKTTEIPCFGCAFQLGVLYDIHNHKVLEQLLNEEEFEQNTETVETKTHDVFSCDSLSFKLKQSQLPSYLTLTFISGSLKSSKSARYRYLCDHKSSSCQARVVLRYQYTQQSKKLTKIMNLPEYFKLSDMSSQNLSATHIIVGVKSGAEAYFIFDKNVSELEDYDTVSSEMVELVKKLPRIAEGKKSLSASENELANQLKCTLHSDFLVIHTQTTVTFEDAVKIYEAVQNYTDTFRPQTVLLYPLNYLDKSFPVTEKIEPNQVKNIVKMLEKLNQLKCKTKYLQQHIICSFSTGINTQLAKFEESIQCLEQNVKKQIRKKRNSHFDDTPHIVDKSALFRQQLWLDCKEKEIEQLDEFLELFKDHEGKILVLTRPQFEDFLSNEVTDYAIILEIELGQMPDIDFDEVHWFKDTKIINHARNEIENFVNLSNCISAKCIVTFSNEIHPSYQRGITVSLYEAGTTSLFEYPVPLHPPKYIKSDWKSIKISLPNHSKQTSQHHSNTVFYKLKSHSLWEEETVAVDQTEVEIDHLEANSEYVFKVAAQYVYGQGPDSEEACFGTTSLSLAVQIRQNMVMIEVNPNQQAQLNQEILVLKTKNTLNDKKKKIAKKEFGTPPLTPIPMKVVMVMGATGSGKSTLINGMVNYILGVKWEDEFRFKLICDETTESQAHSQTDFITAYIFHWQQGFAVQYSLTIIDTPGFGDTRGIERDKQVAMQVKELFSVQGPNGIDTIHGIGFVTQSSLARLTPTQKYVFDSILSIFGNDIKNNIFIMATFADGLTPPVTEAVKAANIPFAELFRFNNSALYEKGKGKDHFIQSFWKMGNKSFTDFFSHLEKARAVSLQLTREVLIEREQLEIILNSIQPKIHQGLSKIDTLKAEETILRARESDILANKDFEYNVKVTKQRKVDLATGRYVTNCLICNFTCHKPCGIPNDNEKYKCSAMDNGGQTDAKCTVCPQKCSWKHHVNNPYYFEIYEEIETRKSDDLLNRYDIAKTDKNKVEAVISKLHDELADLSQDVYKDIRKARQCIERLGQIALKPNPMSEVEYIDLLIESEKLEKTLGYKERIQSYLKVRSQAKIMEKMTETQIDEELKKPDKKKWWQFWLC